MLHILPLEIIISTLFMYADMASITFTILHRVQVMSVGYCITNNEEHCMHS